VNELKEKIEEIRQKIKEAMRHCEGQLDRDQRNSAGYKIIEEKLGRADTELLMSLLRIAEMKTEKAGETPLEELGLRVRTYNCLRRAGIETVEELLEHTAAWVMKIRGLGKQSYDETIAALDKRDLSLRRY